MNIEYYGALRDAQTVPPEEFGRQSKIQRGRTRGRFPQSRNGFQIICGRFRFGHTNREASSVIVEEGSKNLGINSDDFRKIINSRPGEYTYRDKK